MSRPSDFARRWFLARGWKPFAFQKEVWAAVKKGESGLLHANTGSGKTYAVWFAALNRFAKANTLTADNKPRKRKPPAEPLSVLWITPMRALAA
ncbi:DEAD/DEAH box helicase, partial [Pseudomonas amygdali]